MARNRCLPRVEILEDRRLLSTIVAPVASNVHQPRPQAAHSDFFAIGGAPGRVDVFRSSDHSLLASFLPFGGFYGVGVAVAVGDVTGDGTPDLIVGSTEGTSRVRIYNGRDILNDSFDPVDSLIVQFSAYGSFNVGVNLAVGYITSNQFADIVTGANQGNPHVKIFRGSAIADGTFNPANPDASLVTSFFAYPLQFNVGASVAVGDVEGTGVADIITGATTGNPHVKVYGGQAIADGTFDTANPDADLLTSFFAYAVGNDIGVNVAVADTNGDGNADIITGASAGNSHVKVFDGQAIANGTFDDADPDASLLTQFFAYDPGLAGGVRVASADFNGTGFAQILTGNYNGPPHYRILRGDAAGINPPALFEGYPFGFQDSLYVGA
jgi:hypothetical protein